MSHDRCRCDPPLTIQEHLAAVVHVLVQQQGSERRCEENEQALWQLRQTIAVLAGRMKPKERDRSE